VARCTRPPTLFKGQRYGAGAGDRDAGRHEPRQGPAVGRHPPSHPPTIDPGVSPIRGVLLIPEEAMHAAPLVRSVLQPGHRSSVHFVRRVREAGENALAFTCAALML